MPMVLSWFKTSCFSACDVLLKVSFPRPVLTFLRMCVSHSTLTIWPTRNFLLSSAAEMSAGTELSSSVCTLAWMFRGVLQRSFVYESLNVILSSSPARNLCLFLLVRQHIALDVLRVPGFSLLVLGYFLVEELFVVLFGV